MQRQVQTQQEKAGSPALKQFCGYWQKTRVLQESRNLTIFLGLLASATLGRILLQHVPSVEPIIPFAVLAGLLFGMKEGFTLGGSAYVISNFFVWGLQGPWTLFQALGAALAGAMGGLAGRVKEPTARDLIVLSIAGTVLFEFVMNISGALMGIGLFIGVFSIPLYFLTSLPFSAVHICSNIVFAALMKPLLKLRRKEDGLKVISITRVDSGRATTLRMYKPDKH